ncbi:MAG: DEAD/DEAH box helicase [Henriciella sp.]
MTDQQTIPAPLAQALIDRGYDTLTPVQDAVLHPDLEHEDLLVSAQTGSGKTVAFGLALAPTLLAGEEALPRAAAPLALIIAPTRELALQVMRELEWLYDGIGGRLTSCIGGMDMRDERRALSKGVHVVVGTPGRLQDHVKRGSLDLSNIRAVVLDEADEMLDMGFREELEHILGEAPQQRRTLMFSATVSKPIARLAQNYQNDAVRVNTVSEKSQHIDIEYQALVVNPNDADNAIINVLRYHEAETAIVFCSRRETVNKLTSRLNNRGFSVVALSGEYSQKERSNALQALRDGRARVCVATDVAARGLDLPGLDLVIHADLPRNQEGLLHRSGRTGRAGRKGVSALIVPVRAKRRMERLLQDAKVKANWGSPPSVKDVAGRDDARLLDHPALSEPVQSGEQSLAAALLAKYGADQVAAAFIRLQRQGRSAPEEIGKVKEGKASKERGPREDRFPREDKRRGRQQEADFENGSWITLSVGRAKNADPKWILPMLCKAGDIKRDQIGNIRIGQTLTHVELQPDAARKIMDKAGAEGRIDKSLTVRRASGPPAAESRQDRPPRKPYRGKGGDKPASGKAKKPRWAKDDERRKKPAWQPDPTGKKKPRKPRTSEKGTGPVIRKKRKD